MGMQLKTGQCPHVVDPAFDTFLQGKRLVGTSNNDDHFFCLLSVR